MDYFRKNGYRWADDGDRLTREIEQAIKPIMEREAQAGGNIRTIMEIATSAAHYVGLDIIISVGLEAMQKKKGDSHRTTNPV